jgi:DNA repair ATPase RecN
MRKDLESHLSSPLGKMEHMGLIYESKMKVMEQDNERRMKAMEQRYMNKLKAMDEKYETNEMNLKRTVRDLKLRLAELESNHPQRGMKYWDFRRVTNAVIEQIESLGDLSDSGPSVDEICDRLHYFSAEDVRKALNHLSNHGIIYSTIDEDHYLFED